MSHAYLPRIVIVGGGFGGLYAALGLARARATVTIVDKHNYHLFRPMFYQVATGLLSSDEILMAEVVGVDPNERPASTISSGTCRIPKFVSRMPTGNA